MGAADGSLKYRGPNRGAHIYIVFGVVTRRCKIGSSANVWKRFRELQSHSADDLIVWCWARDCGEREPDLHSVFHKFRLHGEWFSSEATEIIAGRVSHSKDPSETLAALAKRTSLRSWVRK
jgi:hypothetical protein